MLVYSKTLAGSSSTVSYTFGKLAKLFRQVVHFLSLPPPSSGKKWPVPAPMIALVSLTRY